MRFSPYLKLLALVAILLLVVMTPQVSAKVINASFPKLYLPLNASPFADYSNNTYTLTNTGSVTANATNYEFGGGSALFSGSNKLSTAANTVVPAGVFSISFWFKRSSTQGQTQMISEVSDDSSYSGTSFNLYFTSANNLFFSVSSSNTGYGITSPIAYTDTNWHYAVVSVNGTNTSGVQMWVDGISNGTATMGGTINQITDRTFAVGGRSTSTSDGFVGYIDDFEVVQNAIIPGGIVPDREFLTNPAASFTAGATTGTAPFSTTLTNTSVGNVLQSVLNMSYINTTYSTPTYLALSGSMWPVSSLPVGNYIFTLTDTNPFGRSNATMQINVTPPPVANFTYSPTSGYSPLTVNFIDTSVTNITAWNWTFGAANYSSLQNPSYTFVGAGNYSVTLQVTNASGTNTTVKYVD
ncbi:MAG: LamG-like jellyroll fold domain-containing protein, partial [Candidatus Paceibacterota bacterium]